MMKYKWPEAAPLDVDLICASNALGSHPDEGGEWDEVRSISRKTKRRLVGAGMMRPGGLPPDVLAEVVSDWFGRPMEPCEVVQWYVRECVKTLDRRIVERNARTYRTRDGQAREQGFQSFWYRRKYRTLQRTERP